MKNEQLWGFFIGGFIVFVITGDIRAVAFGVLVMFMLLFVINFIRAFYAMKKPGIKRQRKSP